MTTYTAPTVQGGGVVMDQTTAGNNVVVTRFDQEHFDGLSDIGSMIFDFALYITLENPIYLSFKIQKKKETDRLSDCGG